MKPVLVFALIGALSAFSPPAISAGDSPPEIVVSNEICSRLWVVPLVWEKEGGPSHELVAVFDTGAQNAFIDPTCLERISGKRLEEGTRVKMEGVTVAGKPFSKFRPRVRDLDHLSRVLGRELDVFLPYQTFGNYLLTLDYPAGEMRLSTGELPEPNGIDVFSSRGPDRRPWLKVQVGTKERKLLIDSGSTGSLSIKPFDGLKWATEPKPLRLFQGMNDLELTGVGRMSGDVEVGPLVLQDPVVSLTDDTELVGAGVLRNLIITCDQKHRRLRLEMAVENPVRLDPFRGTGAVMRALEDSYVIRLVTSGSPADLAGLKAGDLVTHMDGVNVLERGCRGFDKQDAESVELVVQRGGDRWEVEVDIVVLVP